MTNKAEGTHLVSDEQIIKTSESYADLMMTKNDGESYSTHLSGCEYGSKNIRDIYEADRSALLRERDALQAFKDYVHQRLDEAGIATHPPGEHADAGCRVGQRMDLLVGKRDEAVKLLGQIVDDDVDSFVDAGGYGSHTTEHRCLVCGSSECEPDCTMVEIRTFLGTLKP